MLRLEAQPGAKVPKLPDQGKVLAVAAEEISTLDAPWKVAEGETTTLRVKTGHFTLNASLNLRRKADRLVVTFHGARRSKAGDTKNTSPMFMRHDWDEAYECPILSISDPLGEQNWGAGLPRPSLYFGDFEHDLVPEINALIDKACDEIGVSRDNVVLYGASSGGSAALCVGARRSSKTGVIAVCPYLRPKKYREQVVKVVAKAMGGDLDAWNNCIEEEPERLNPIAAMDLALEAGSDFRAVIVQNTLDAALLNHHFPILWKHFGMDLEGGFDASGRIMSALYTADAGHGQEPDELVLPLYQMALKHFQSPLNPQPITVGAGMGKKEKKKQQ